MKDVVVRLVHGKFPHQVDSWILGEVVGDIWGLTVVGWAALTTVDVRVVVLPVVVVLLTTVVVIPVIVVVLTALVVSIVSVVVVVFVKFATFVAVEVGFVIQLLAADREF
jgi:hypothetical protein